MISTFWITNVEAFVSILDFFPDIKFTIVCIGNPFCHALYEPYEKSGHLTQVSGDGGPLFSALCHFGRYFGISTVIESLMEYIDNRLVNKNIKTGQVFFSGLYNYGNFENFSPDNDLERFRKFVKKDSKKYLRELLECGKNIFKSEIQTAEKKALNSKIIQLKSGSFAAITQVSDKINLTHDALHEKYPDVAVTIALSLDFTGPQPMIRHSLRSYDKNVNVTDLIKVINGGGNAVEAGGQTNFTFEIPY